MTPHDPTEERDPQVAVWLAVEPLDELTRTRLVRNALAAATEAATPRSRRPWYAGAAAAALLVAVVVGVLALVDNSDDETAPTAARAPNTTETAPAAREQSSGQAEDKATGPAAAPTEDDSLRSRGSASPTYPSLGELGDVSTRARLRAATKGWEALASNGAATTPAPCARSLSAGVGTLLATGTGTVDGEPATVAITDRGDGTRAAIAFVHEPCGLGPQIRLR